MITISRSPSSLSVSTHAAMQASHMHSKPMLFPLVECYGLLAIYTVASSPNPSIYSKDKISYPLLLILLLLRPTWNHITKIMKAVHYFQTIVFSHLQSPWHYHNSPHTRWTCTSKVISCSSQISEPQTSLVAPPFTTLTPSLSLLQLLCHKPHMLGNLLCRKERWNLGG